MSAPGDLSYVLNKEGYIAKNAELKPCSTDSGRTPQQGSFDSTILFRLHALDAPEGVRLFPVRLPLRRRDSGSGQVADAIVQPRGVAQPAHGARSGSGLPRGRQGREVSASGAQYDVGGGDWRDAICVGEYASSIDPVRMPTSETARVIGARRPRATRRDHGHRGRGSAAAGEFCAPRGWSTRWSEQPELLRLPKSNPRRAAEVGSTEGSSAARPRRAKGGRRLRGRISPTTRSAPRAGSLTGPGPLISPRSPESRRHGRPFPRDHRRTSTKARSELGRWQGQSFHQHDGRSASLVRIRK